MYGVVPLSALNDLFCCCAPPHNPTLCWAPGASTWGTRYPRSLSSSASSQRRCRGPSLIVQCRDPRCFFAPPNASFIPPHHSSSPFTQPPAVSSLSSASFSGRVYHPSCPMAVMSCYWMDMECGAFARAIVAPMQSLYTAARCQQHDVLCVVRLVFTAGPSLGTETPFPWPVRCTSLTSRWSW